MSVELGCGHEAEFRTKGFKDIPTSLHIHMPGDRSEYMKRYREAHREHLAALEHARWERKKEELKEIRNAKHECETCGGRFTYANKSFHVKSKKHQAALATSEPG